jgi:hypothetical protein
MSGTIAAAAKKQLVGTSNVLVAVLAGFTGDDAVKVAYDDPKDKPRRVVFGGQVAGPVQLSAMRGSARIKREENLNLNLFIRVYEPGHETTETTDTDAVAISALIENYIAANNTLGGVTDLLKASVEGFSLDSFLTDDGGATSIVTLTLSLHSFLS